MAKLMGYSRSYKPHSNVQKITIDGKEYRVTKFLKDGNPLLYIVLIDISGFWKEIDIRKINGFFTPPEKEDLIMYFRQIVNQQKLTLEQLKPI